MGTLQELRLYGHLVVVRLGSGGVTQAHDGGIFVLYLHLTQAWLEQPFRRLGLLVNRYPPTLTVGIFQ